MTCNKNTICCFTKNQKLRKRGTTVPDCCYRHLNEMLANLSIIFKDLDYWVDFGTLLGIIRENRIIPFDHDLDFGLMLKDLDKLEALKPQIEAMGHHLMIVNGWHHGLEDPANVPFPRIFYSKKNRIFADIYLWNYISNTEVNIVRHPQEKTTMYSCLEDYYINTKTIDFNGIKLKIPNNAEDYLKLRYGPTWKIPDPNFYETYPNGYRYTE